MEKIKVRSYFSEQVCSPENKGFGECGDYLGYTLGSYEKLSMG